MVIDGTNIHCDKIAFFNGLFLRHAVRQGAVLSGNYDQIKGNAFRAVSPHKKFDFQRQLPFRDSFLDFSKDVGKSGVGNFLGCVHLPKLPRLLDPAHLVQKPV